MYLDAGQDDGDSRRGNALIFKMLEGRGVAVTMNIVQGESHSFVAWRRNLLLSLPWTSKWFASQTAGSGVSTVAPPETGYLPPPSLTDLGVSPKATGAPCPEAGTRRRTKAGSANTSSNTSTTLHGSSKVVGSCNSAAGGRVTRTPTGQTTTTTSPGRRTTTTRRGTATTAAPTTSTERPASSSTTTPP